MGGSIPASPQAEAGRKACALGLEGDASEGYQSVNERVYCLAGLDEGLVLEPLERDMCCSRPLASTRSLSSHHHLTIHTSCLPPRP